MPQEPGTAEQAASRPESQVKATPNFFSSILPFPDGPVYTIRDPKMEDYLVMYHKGTGALLHGGEIKKVQDSTSPVEQYFFGERPLGPCRDRYSFVIALIASADASAELEDRDTETTNQIKSMISQHNSAQRPMLQIKVHIRSGVALHELPIGPWSITPDELFDGHGELAYTRVGKEPPVPPVAADDTESLLSRARKFMGLRRG